MNNTTAIQQISLTIFYKIYQHTFLSGINENTLSLSLTRERKTPFPAFLWSSSVVYFKKDKLIEFYMLRRKEQQPISVWNTRYSICRNKFPSLI